MPKYTFTRVYVVEAESQADALEKCRTNPTKHLTFESVTVDQHPSEGRRPWRSAVKQQFTGK